MKDSSLKNFPLPHFGKKGWPWEVDTASLSKVTELGSWPKISIVTPNYNYDGFIEETMRSVLLQGYPNLEYIVIDDGSTDDSCEVIKKYESWLTHWESQPNGGQSKAINKGFSISSGQILGWLNSDDILAPNCLWYVANYFTKHQDCKWLVGTCGIINEEGIVQEPFTTKFYGRKGFTEFWRRDLLPQPSSFWTRDILSPWEVKLREDLKYCMDFELWLRFLEKSSPSIIDTVLAYYRMHSRAHTVSVPDHFLKEKVKLSRHDWRKRGLFIYLKCEWYWRKQSANSDFNKAFALKQNGRRAEAVQKVVRAFLHFPFIALSYKYLNLILRLIFRH